MTSPYPHPRHPFVLDDRTRSSPHVIDQLWAALEFERVRVAELERERAILLRQWVQAQVELARRKMRDALAAAASPSDQTH